MLFDEPFVLKHQIWFSNRNGTVDTNRYYGGFQYSDIESFFTNPYLNLRSINTRVIFIECDVTDRLFFFKAKRFSVL